MINFTVGPVQSNESVLDIGGKQTPYFRTEEFSNIMLENEKLIKEFTNSTDDSRVVFITGSGTASMESAIINNLTNNDKVLIINGGSFGKRFIDICEVHSISYTEIKLNFGEQITKNHLALYENKGYTAFIVNIHETSTGILYDMNVISEFCKRNKLFLIVDAISSFLADELDMKKHDIDILISSSQKALACPPGISFLVLSPNALNRINNASSKSYYLDLKSALVNGERGQTPFTPAVSILLQINARLKQIKLNGGVKFEIEKTKLLAKDFRKRIKGFPFEIAVSNLSNAITSLKTINISAYKLFLILKNEYDIWVCPSGGELKEKVFRVGHIGDLTIEDNNKLISAFEDLNKRGLI